MQDKISCLDTGYWFLFLFYLISVWYGDMMAGTASVVVIPGIAPAARSAVAADLTITVSGICPGSPADFICSLNIVQYDITPCL